MLGFTSSVRVSWSTFAIGWRRHRKKKQNHRSSNKSRTNTSLRVLFSITLCALYPKYFPSLHTDLINVCSQYPYEECVTAAVETKKLGHQVATRLTWGDTERLGKNWEQNADPKAPRPPPSYRESTSGERQFYKLAAYNIFLKHNWLNVLKIANVDKPVLFPNKWRRV